MELKEAELNGGKTWFLGAGIIAVLFSWALFCADTRVMAGARDRDRAFNERLRELRLAQASLPSGSVDARIIAAGSPYRYQDNVEVSQ